MTTILPQTLADELNADAKAAGYTSKRINHPRSRWHYFRKLLHLGRQNKELISLPPQK
jgi:hypothetical protein